MLTAERQVKRLASIDFPVPVEALERMRVPKSFNPRSPQSRRDLASALRTKAGHIAPERAPQAAGRGRRRPRDRPAAHRDPRAHPCHGCDEREDHARWAERYHRLQRDTRQLERRIEGRTNTIARTFDRIVALLTELDYLRGDEVTEDGRRLARLYGELDLLASECLRDRRLGGAQPRRTRRLRLGVGLRGPRRRTTRWHPSCPSGQGEGRARRDGPHLGPARRPGGGLPDQPDAKGVGQREPDLGFAWAAYMWASGKGLDEVLREAEMPAGDFVRWCKQVIDVLGQIAAARAPGRGVTVAKNARKAVDAAAAGSGRVLVGGVVGVGGRPRRLGGLWFGSVGACGLFGSARTHRVAPGPIGVRALGWSTIVVVRGGRSGTRASRRTS